MTRQRSFTNEAYQSLFCTKDVVCSLLIHCWSRISL